MEVTEVDGPSSIILSILCLQLTNHILLDMEICLFQSTIFCSPLPLILTPVIFKSLKSLLQRLKWQSSLSPQGIRQQPPEKQILQASTKMNCGFLNNVHLSEGNFYVVICDQLTHDQSILILMFPCVKLWSS